MKVVILAGGFGTRLGEETQVRPKPLVEIGGRPILWHIMKHYSHYGFNEFYIALGYKGEQIKRYFMDYKVRESNMTIQLNQQSIVMHNTNVEDWEVHLIDTGLNTMTGGRIKRLASYLSDAPFMVTYGDGVSNIDLHALVEFHKQHNSIGTVTAVRPPPRFGSLVIEKNHLVAEFKEKSPVSAGWINGGFFVFEPEFLNYLHNDSTVMESNALEALSSDNQLYAYQHTSFWQCMDTIRDKKYLESLWANNEAQWKIWAE